MAGYFDGPLFLPFFFFFHLLSSVAVFLFPSVPRVLSPTPIVQEPLAIRNTSAPTPNVSSSFVQSTQRSRVSVDFWRFPKWTRVNFMFISSPQTGLNLHRRRNIPTCCVKLYELMKSAGSLVRDLVWGNTVPVVLYTHSGRCFPKMVLPRVIAVLYT